MLLLRQGVRRREDPRPAPESQALQVPCMPKEAIHRWRHGHPCPPGTQGECDQVCIHPLPIPELELIVFWVCTAKLGLCILFYDR